MTRWTCRVSSVVNLLHRRALLTLIFLVAGATIISCGGEEEELEQPRMSGLDVSHGETALTASDRRTRAGEIRDTAAARGLTQGWLFAGIADAETQMSHCWSELTWACEGPPSVDCGGGATVAGAGDGPCWMQEGGLGLFQFDAGTFDDTLAREGDRILTIAGNTDAAVDFVLTMVVDSTYIAGVSNWDAACDWLNGVRVNNDRFHPWIQTVTHYYNGCRPGWSCYSERYSHYRDNASNIYSEMGAEFWNVAGDGDSGMTVGELIAEWGCSTAPTIDLNAQVAAQMNCIEAGFFERIDDIPNLSLGAAANPFLQRPAAEALRRAAAENPDRTFVLNSSWRSVVQQYILYTWQGSCGISIASYPGHSNHESGLAIDVPLPTTEVFRDALSENGYYWYCDAYNGGWASGCGDIPHHDYVAGGVDLRSPAVLAFQQLWNNAHPEEPIAEDGVFGDQTATRLHRAPLAGFSVGTTCGGTIDPEPTPVEVAIEVYWHREDDGSYSLRALAPAVVESVIYRVDTWDIGSASRADGHNFPTSYTFSLESQERHFEVIGFDADGVLVGRGIGLIDVTEGTGVYIRQMGNALYEIGLERAPESVAFIEVDADSWTLTDMVTESTRSDRNAVRSTFFLLGPRSFQIRTYNADGSLRGTLRRSFELQ